MQAPSLSVLRLETELTARAAGVPADAVLNWLPRRCAPCRDYLTVFGLFGPPIARRASETTEEDTSLAFDDPSGQGVASVAFPQPPTHGTLTADAITETGGTGADYHGVDHFKYVVTSPVIGTSTPQPVRVDVTIPPTVTSFTPASGPAGTMLTITGTNIMGSTSVAFNGIKAVNSHVVSATTVTATVPAGVATGKITVTTPGGAATSSAVFTVE